MPGPPGFQSSTCLIGGSRIQPFLPTVTGSIQGSKFGRGIRFCIPLPTLHAFMSSRSGRTWCSLEMSWHLAQREEFQWLRPWCPPPIAESVVVFENCRHTVYGLVSTVNILIHKVYKHILKLNDAEGDRTSVFSCFFVCWMFYLRTLNVKGIRYMVDLRSCFNLFRGLRNARMCMGSSCVAARTSEGMWRVSSNSNPLCVFICLVCLVVCFFVCLLDCLFACLFACLFVWCLFVCLLGCLFVCLLVCLSVCLSACLFFLFLWGVCATARMDLDVFIIVFPKMRIQMCRWESLPTAPVGRILLPSHVCSANSSVAFCLIPIVA